MKLISKEFIFAFFLLSGTLKGVLGFVPIDITVLSLGLSVMTAAFPILKKKTMPKHPTVPTAIYLSLSLFIIFTLIYSQGNFFSYEKALRFLVITGWSFVGVLFIIKDKSSLERFFKSFLALSFVMAAASLIQYFSAKGSAVFIGALGANYIALGRMAGFGVLILICLYLYNNELGHRKTIVVYLSIILLSISLFLSGGRMPVISLGLSVLVIISLSARLTKRGLVFDKIIRKLLFFCMFGILTLIPFYLNGLFDTFIMRMKVLFEGDGGASVVNRFDRLDVGMTMFSQNPLFGKGIGSFPVFYASNDVNDYPHNIFVELLSETGLVGLSIFILLFTYAVIKYINARRIEKKINRYHILIFSFFTYMFLTVNVAGDINDNRLFFTALGLMCVSPLIVQDKTTKQNNESAAQNKTVR